MEKFIDSKKIFSLMTCTELEKDQRTKPIMAYIDGKLEENYPDPKKRKVFKSKALDRRRAAKKREMKIQNKEPNAVRQVISLQPNDNVEISDRNNNAPLISNDSNRNERLFKNFHIMMNTLKRVKFETSRIIFNGYASSIILASYIDQGIV
ncbi:unnamed protein product [Brachionus calyciflorus]|uniref:Uncharacterized protein n=1 Tax=Brachionus calyciflorus TaxID=104777 RepID=A0A814ARJ8_9BILA|nr:unnamed protein product [Brachionus calyciflorus]